MTVVAAPRRTPFLAPLLLVAAAAAAAAIVVAFTHDGWMLDLGVYRRGALDVLHGRDLYASTAQFPFTYPPFAAVLLIPVSVLGSWGSSVAMLLISATSYVVFAGVCLRRLGVALGPWTVATLAVAGLALEPVARTLAMGQVNLVLAALVVVDLLVLPPRHRGWLIGIAAGVKLVPGVFVLVLLLRREWGGVARFLGGLAATVAIGTAAAPHPSWDYWTQYFYSSDHVGGAAYVANQSLNGALLRLGRDEHPPTIAYLALAITAIALATWAARRSLARGDELAAVTAIAFGGLLASPISWTHHWVWFLPGLLLLGRDRRWLLVVLIVPVVVLAPMYDVPAYHLAEFHHTWWQATLALTYTAAGLAILAALGTGRRTLPT